jgi:hypothetical protein
MSERRKRTRLQSAGRSHPITYKGRTQRLSAWADQLGMSRKSLTSRLARGMSPEQAFTSPTRVHATVDQITERRAALYKIVKAQQPMTVRGVFYQAEVFLPQFIAKTSNGYKMVASDLVKMRKAGKLPYDWIVDNTRNAIRPHAYDDIAHALRQTAANYRSDLWKDKDCLVQVWLEKDALSGVIDSVTLDYGVPLMVARGYSSLSFIHEQAALLRHEDRPVYIYLLGDHDTYGVNAHESIEATLREMAPDVDFHFKPLAVTKDQIRHWRLPTRETDPDNKRQAAFDDGRAVELDAIEPNKLRKLVEDAINKHMTADERDELLENDEDARDYIRELAKAAP